MAQMDGDPESLSMTWTWKTKTMHLPNPRVIWNAQNQCKIW